MSRRQRTEWLITKLREVAHTVDEEVFHILSGEPKQLYDASSYMPSLGGKRMRPFITVESARLFGDDDKATRLAGASVELLHNFTLVHDDIMDKDDFRRGKPTVHKIFGESLAILAGDLLFSKAFYAASMSEELSGVRGVVKALSVASARVDEGQYMDISFESRHTVSEEEYLSMIYLKTAALYECAAIMGGIVGGPAGTERKHGEPEDLASLREYGKSLGLAFQIRDDYLGTFGESRLTGKPVGNDVRRGKKTLVIVLAKQRCSSTQEKIIDSVLGSNIASDSEVHSVVDLFVDLGVDRECEDRAWKYASEAKARLQRLPAQESRRLLEELADYSVYRTS